MDCGLFAPAETSRGPFPGVYIHHMHDTSTSLVKYHTPVNSSVMVKYWMISWGWILGSSVCLVRVTLNCSLLSRVSSVLVLISTQFCLSHLLKFTMKSVRFSKSHFPHSTNWGINQHNVHTITDIVYRAKTFVRLSVVFLTWWILPTSR